MDHDDHGHEGAERADAAPVNLSRGAAGSIPVASTIDDDAGAP